nr:M23 family metallopeptidase [Anaerolineae bacterium]
MPKPQILLLPSDNYWGWVHAVRDYAVQFNVSVTPRLENALSFHYPTQVITVVNVPGIFPGIEDLRSWLLQQAPGVTVDVINVSTPGQLHHLLSQRIRDNMPLAIRDAPLFPSGAAISLKWPTDFPAVVQGFGENPELYRRWGLPGHEGIDIRAPINANIYACAEGYVYRIHNGTGGHPYGIHVRVRHDGGFRTVYAHLNQVNVRTGQYVQPGDVIGLAGSTGNSDGGHLHLVLKHEGASRQQTGYPGDIVNPTPYFVSPHLQSVTWNAGFDWPYQTALVGVCARPGSPLEGQDWAVIRTARIQAIKLTHISQAEDVATAREIYPNMFFLAQLVPDFPFPSRSADYTEWLAESIEAFYQAGVRYYEIHREPNLRLQGFGQAWSSGYEFGRWFLDVLNRLRGSFPDGRFGWPGLMPGASVSGMRQDCQAFLESAQEAVGQADWIGCQCYWGDESGLFAESGGLSYEMYRDRWPDKLLLITEFSNPSPHVGAQLKGAQYLQYYRHLRETAGVGGAFSHVLSSPRRYHHEVWRTEDGGPTGIVAAIASRPF